MALITDGRMVFQAENVNLSKTSNPVNAVVRVGDDTGEAHERLEGELFNHGKTR